MPSPVLDDIPALGVMPASTTREPFGFPDAEKGKSASVAWKRTQPSHDPTNTTSSGIIFYDNTRASSNVGDDCPSGTDIPRASMFGFAGEGQPDTSRFARDAVSPSRGLSHSEPPPHFSPLTTRYMHPSPLYNPVFHDSQNPGYSARFPPSYLPFVSPPSPCNQQRSEDFRHTIHQRDVQHLSPYPYLHPYRPPGASDTNTINHDGHASYQTGVQTAQTLNFPGNSSEVIPTAHRPFGNVGSYAPRSPPPSHQQSPSHMTSGYASASPLQSVNYSHQNSAPAYGYPPPPGYSPSSPVYSSYSTSPYNHPLPLEANRQRTWWYNPHHAGAPLLQSFDGTVEYQRNYSAPYSMPPQINPIHPSTPLPPMSPPPSPPLPGPSSPERRLGVGLASGSGSRAGKKSLVRRSYHPNPPSYRSDWVMWAGNIPTNAVHNELWRFFTSFPESTSDASAKSGVLSIFLISRSNCAFINYEEESYLKVAIDHFNGCSLRPGDPRCPKLVCRMRNTDDDLKAGVGGQRGVGMHTLWVKERKDKSILRTEASSDSHDAPSMLPDKSPRSISSDGASGTRHRPQSMTSSSSYTSTNSSFLARFFSQRYFILKSLTQADLDFSKENGLWATQRHNEEILDQAFRTSQNVYLIFSANKSGEFYGYARMAGPIRRGGHKVTWALRNSETSSSRPSSFSAGSVRGDGSAHASTQDGNLYFTAVSNRLVDNATFSMTEGTPKGGSDTSSVRYFENVHSAPAELEIVHKKTTPRASSGRNSLDYPLLTPLMCDEPTPDDFELDSMAPVRAMRSKRRESPLEIVVEEAERHGDDATSAKDVEKREKRDDWGQPFKVEWLSTEKISFQKTRHLRNPWNHMREVKVSRDGTELESTVGRKLISDWAVLAAM